MPRRWEKSCFFASVWWGGGCLSSWLVKNVDNPWLVCGSRGVYVGNSYIMPGLGWVLGEVYSLEGVAESDWLSGDKGSRCWRWTEQKRRSVLESLDCEAAKEEGKRSVETDRTDCSSGPYSFPYCGKTGCLKIDRRHFQAEQCELAGQERCT